MNSQESRKSKKNSGSALIWALMLLVVAAVMLACILPLAAASITNSQQSNYKQQAYYTAKSVTDMLVEYIVSDAVERTDRPLASQPVGYQILTKAKASDEDDGYDYLVKGLGDMGSCKANVRYAGGKLYVKSTAAYGEEQVSLTAVLEQGNGIGSFDIASSYVTGVYEGIRAASITQTEGSTAAIKMNKGNILLTGLKDPSKEESTWPVSNVIVESIPLTSDKTDKTPKLYTLQDIVNHNAISTVDSEYAVRGILAGKNTETDGNIILDNPDNIFEICSNDYVAEKKNNYVFYTAGTVHLKGQIDLQKPDASNNPGYSITSGKLILEGTNVDPSKNIGMLKGNGTHGGIYLEGTTIYADQGLKLDNVKLEGTQQRGNSNGGIYCDGPVFLSNRQGGVSVSSTNTSTDALVNGSYVEIKSTTLPTSENEELDNNRIYINGRISSYNFGDENCRAAGSDAEANTKIHQRFADAIESEESPEYQALVAEYQADMAKVAAGTDPNAYADESMLWNLKKYFKGDIVLDASKAYDEAGNEIPGRLPSMITVEQTLFSMGDITISGNVTLNGDIRCGGTLTLNGGVHVKGSVSATNVIINDWQNAPVVIDGTRTGGYSEGSNTPIMKIGEALEYFQYKTWDDYEEIISANDMEKPLVSGNDMEKRPANVKENGPVNILTHSEDNGCFYLTMEGTKFNPIVRNTCTLNVTLSDRLSSIYEETASLYQLNIGDYGTPEMLDVTRISNRTLKIDDRTGDNSVKASNFYQIPYDLNLKEVNLQSYSDTYFIIPADKEVKIDEVTTDSYFPNLIFILEDGARLILNESGVDTSVNVHVFSKTKDNGSKLILGEHTTYYGSIDVDLLEVGDNLVYQYQEMNDLAGGFREGSDGWRVVQYLREAK